MDSHMGNEYRARPTLGIGERTQASGCRLHNSTNKTWHGIYNDNTTAITASNPPILKSDWCQDTGLWRLNLNPDNKHVTPEMINVIFDFPSSRKTFLLYHASARFPPKETYIDAVCNGNYATWSKLAMPFINQYYPNSDETMKRHLKGQRQGIRSTKQKALEKIIENETVRIKIEGKKSPLHHIPITKTHKIFFCIEDLSNSIHTNQTGAFPFTSQCGNRYIMVAIHLNANYIFVKPMHSRSKEEMIWAYEKIINRMRLAGLGLKKHTWTTKPQRPSNNASKNNG
jgi:hypothetical protein